MKNKKVNNQNKPSTHGREKFNKPSKTEPGKSMTMRELKERFASGLTLKEHEFVTEENVVIEDSNELNKMTPVERIEYAREMKKNITKVNDEIIKNRENREKEQKEKELQEMIKKEAEKHKTKE